MELEVLVEVVVGLLFVLLPNMSYSSSVDVLLLYELLVGVLVL